VEDQTKESYNSQVKRVQNPTLTVVWYHIQWPDKPGRFCI